VDGADLDLAAVALERVAEAATARTLDHVTTSVSIAVIFMAGIIA
jgi:hypothetical protein